MRLSWWASYFAREKSGFSRAHVTRGRVPWDLHFFAFTTFTHECWKEAFFRQEKRKKQLFSATFFCKLKSTFKKRGKKLIKTSDIFRKTSEKKRKPSELFSRKLRRFFIPFRWRLWKQKVQNCCDARACEEGTDRKRKLYAVIATNNKPFVIQIHQTKISMDLPTHAPQHKWRTTHSQMPRERASAFTCSRIEKHRKLFNLISVHNRTRHTITLYVTFSAIFLSLPSYPPIYY